MNLGRIAPAVCCLAMLVISPCAWAYGEEDFGNAPLNPANFREYEGILPTINHQSRVYHAWVNSSEHFYYEGDTKALNDVMEKFSSRKAKTHEIVLLPGPARPAKSLLEGKETPYNWSLHIQRSGLTPATSGKEKGTNVFDKDPTLRVYVDGAKVKLEELKIPAGAAVLEPSDMRKRYLGGLKSGDWEVRGQAMIELAGLKPHNPQDVEPVAALLKDPDPWVRVTAASALGKFGKEAQPALPALKLTLANEGDKPDYRESYKKAILAIENAKDESEEAEEKLAIQKKIGEFRRAMDGKGWGQFP